MLNVLKWPTPPFSCVLKLVVELVLLKSVKFAGYKRFGVFVFDGHFDPIAIFFLGFWSDLPPHFQVFWRQWCNKISLIYHHLEDIGVFDFCSSWLTFPVCAQNFKVSRACPFIFKGWDVDVGVFVKLVHHVITLCILP
jgi:hypothetical protein